MYRDGRGLGSKLVSFTKGFSKHPHILVIFKVDSECLRFPFKVKVDYYFGGARSKGFATLRNVSKLQFFDKIGHAKSVGFRFYSAI